MCRVKWALVHTILGTENLLGVVTPHIPGIFTPVCKTYQCDGPVVESLLYNRSVVGSSPDRVTPKTLKMVLTAFSSGARNNRMDGGS